MTQEEQQGLAGEAAAQRRLLEERLDVNKEIGTTTIVIV